MRRRALIYAALALAVPLPAFALSGGNAPPGASLSVSASLDECGIASSSVVCKIDASWNEVAGAERYTATITSPDGAVTDYGDVGGTSTSMWVPYVGNGTYTVTVSAWGTPPGADKPEVIAKQRAGTGSSSAGASKPGVPQTFSNDGQGGAATGSDPDPADPVPSDPGSDPPPACDPAEAADADAGAADQANAAAATAVAESGTDECPEPADPGTTTTSTTTTTTTPETPSSDGG
jgi:hypothetical protein